MATDRLETVLKRYLIAEFDELYRLGSREYLDEDYELAEEVERYLEDMYIEGFSSAFYMLGMDVEAPEISFMLAAIWAEIEGLNFRDRLERELYDWEIWRIVRTEGHRVFVEGQSDGARQAAETSQQPIVKRWVSRLDLRVRNTHQDLEGVTLPLDGWFVTPNGQAQRPGEFGVAEEDVNCRCVLHITTGRTAE